MAAIQGLNAKLEARITKQQHEIAEQAKAIAELRRTVEVLMARSAAEGPVAQTQ